MHSRRSAPPGPHRRSHVPSSAVLEVGTRVAAYLHRHGLSDRVALVVARTSHDPALLKPSPHLLEIAVQKLAADPAATTLVGDSLTDIEAAQRARIASIGYANKPGKQEAMTQVNTGAAITSMADLALALRPQLPSSEA